MSLRGLVPTMRTPLPLYIEMLGTHWPDLVMLKQLGICSEPLARCEYHEGDLVKGDSVP